MIFKANTAMN